MKKKILFVLVLFLGLSSISLGQDFKPSEDAQGYEVSKNFMVDYSTGLLYYKIPLVVLTSGDFLLPVSLNFQSRKGRGCWTLQFGGVVSRVMRGGVPDEKKGSGYIHVCSASGGVPLKMKEVNMHKQDGECDIFTVSFGGENVNFHVRKGDSGIEAVPLERTNVRIVCEANSEADSIMGWNVTDEHGIKYIYREQEITREIQRKEAVGINNLEEDRYVSAWHLTRIEIPGKKAIDFCYNGSCSEWNGEERLIHYYYGRSMIEYKFDLNYYNSLYIQRMENVMRALENASRNEEFARESLQALEGIDLEWSRMSALMNSFNREKMLFNFMGVLSEYAKVPVDESIVTAIIGDLNKMINECRRETYIEVVEALLAAKQCIIDMFQASSLKESKDRLVSDYKIEVPALERIVTPDKELVLEYVAEKLTGVMLQDYKADLIQKIVLSNNKQGEMRELSWHDRDGEKVKNQLFRYGKAGGEWSVLTQVILDTKGSINMEYEDNTCSTRDTVEGFRLKSLVIKDENGNTDSVKYHYPYPGNVIYKSISRREKVTYDGFEDEVFSETPFYNGVCYVNTGNNGVYYHYVEEELVGKGTNTYLYSVPGKYGVYSFWVCGLLLAKGAYDVSGNLMACEKRRYWTDLNVTKFQAGGEKFFVDAPEQVKYSRKIGQLRPYPYYIDKDSSRALYRKQPKILLYKDGSQEVYLDPMQLWQKNVQPRTDYKNILSCMYSLGYGGKTLLKEREEYQFSGNVSSSPSIEHLTGDLPAGGRLVTREEYVYDNLDAHVSPTRVVRKLANGDERVLSRKTPLDYLPGVANWIDQMRERNVVAPLIKERYLLKKKGSDVFKLLNENAVIYGKRVTTSGDVVFVPEKRLEYAGEGLEQVSWPVLEGKVLTFPGEEYRETVMTYSLCNEVFLPVETLAPGERVACCYDQVRNNLILKVDGVAKNNTDAVDRYRVQGETSGSGGSNLPEFLEVTPVDGVNRFRVFFWCMPTSSSLDVAYSVKYKGGGVNLTSGSRKVSAGKWQLLFFDVDVAVYPGVLSIKVFFPAAGKVAMGVMVPADAVFEAISTDSFGREFCTFNQQGQVVRNEYDRANRLHRTYDGDGNVLEIYRYENIH